MQVTGPIGMVEGLSARMQSSWAEGIAHVADLSIMLGVANLLPIPSLDGSRLLFLILGYVRRKELPARAEAIVHTVGIILLFALLIVVSILDLRR